MLDWRTPGWKVCISSPNSTSVNFSNFSGIPSSCIWSRFLCSRHRVRFRATSPSLQLSCTSLSAHFARSSWQSHNAIIDLSSQLNKASLFPLSLLIPRDPPPDTTSIRLLANELSVDMDNEFVLHCKNNYNCQAHAGGNGKMILTCVC